MKLTISLILLFAASAFAQDEPKICVSQDAINKCASAATELLAARDAISQFTVERTTSIAERTAAAKVIEGLNNLLAIKDRQIAAYEQINALKDSVIKLQMEIIEKYAAQLNKGRSAFD